MAAMPGRGVESVCRSYSASSVCKSLCSYMCMCTCIVCGSCLFMNSDMNCSVAGTFLAVIAVQNNRVVVWELFSAIVS